MDVTRRRLLTLLAGSLGLGSVLGGRARAVSGVSEITRVGTVATPATSAPAVPIPETLTVIGRDGWSSRAQGTFRRHRVERITIHHTAVKLTDNRLAPTRLRRHEDWHRSHDWPDLAYHFVVDRAGNVYEGRPVDAVGDTFTRYDPTGHLLPCFEGDFNRQEPTAEQLAAMARLVGWAMQTYSISADRITGHRDWATTTCPGDDVYWRLGGIGRAARDHDPMRLSYLRGPTARARVAEIEQGS